MKMEICIFIKKSHKNTTIVHIGEIQKNILNWILICFPM